MKKAWKEFWSDYNEMVLKNSNKWLKKHWKGYIILCIASFVLSFTASFGITSLIKIRKENQRKDLFKDLLNEREEEES